MNILILGGTGFLGPHVVESALAKKHTLTLFNRGKTNPKLFPELEKLQGDRNKDVAALKDRKWDAVVDTSGYTPGHVRIAAEVLAPNIKQYVFVSTVSVYANMSKPGTDESAPVAPLPEGAKGLTNETYGPYKALAEQQAEKMMPGKVAVVRPTLIVGPGDPTDRFTYWPVRIDRGGEVLAPLPKESPVQYIDARDLADFIIKLIDDGHVGTYNVAGPRAPLTMAELLYGIRASTASDVRFNWVDESFLDEKQVGAWMDLPLWIPPGGPMSGMQQADTSKALAAGLAYRPLAVTAADTLKWAKENLEKDHKWGAGLTPEREAEVLKAWKEKSATTKPT